MWHLNTDLHTVGKQPDWELVPTTKRNNWQQIAASTRGILAPGNIVSVIGLCLVLFGLFQIYNGELFNGLIWVALGRVADILDGIIAQKTGTKSLLGESIDITIDKITVIVVLIVFLVTGILPVLAAMIIAGRNGINMALGLLAKAQRKNIHPVRAGKYAAAVEWMAILLFALSALQTGSLSVTMYFILAYITLAIALVLGATALKSYGGLADNKQH